jgi:putative transcriptional regulator
MDDPRFDRSVALVLAHDDDAGSVALILTSPEVVSGPVNGVLSEWLESAPRPASVFNGGPVQEDGFICLVEDDDAECRVTTVDILASDPTPGRRHRIFRGHAGWSPGQLAHEMALGVWLVASATHDDIFTGTPQTLWSDVMRRQPSPFSRLANLPSRPSLN